MKIFKKTLKFITGTLCWLFLLFTIIGVAGIYFGLDKLKPFLIRNFAEAKDVVNESSEKDFLTNETTYIFNDSGRVIRKLTLDQDSKYLTFEEIPTNVINAFISVEDRNFWNHKGIDLKGIVRVIYDYIASDGQEMHGASTITQQITRRTFLNFDVTLSRKIKEIFYAFELEKKYPKEKILEFYINDIYYANNCYGIASASKFYFNKELSELSLSQIAYICAIPQQPAYFNPVVDVNRAIPRRDKILNDMYTNNYITEQELNDALAEEVKLDLSGNDIKFSNYQTTYAINCAVEYLMEINGFNFRYVFEDDDDFKKYNKLYNEEYDKFYKELCSGGYRIYTSLNDKKQDLLQTVTDEKMSVNAEVSEIGIYSLQSASTLIDNSTGKVVAIVGGRTQSEEELNLDVLSENSENSENSEGSENNIKNNELSDDKINVYSLNRAFQSFRQPGSSIKPIIVYAPALESGKFNKNSTIYSINVRVANNGSDIEKMSGMPWNLTNAVAQSDNGSAYYVYFRVGPLNGIEKIQNMKFKKITPDDYYMPASLGGFTYGVSTVEMASAYATLANHGFYRKPTCITSIIDNDGNEIFKESDIVQIYDSKASKEMLEIMKEVITRGTASKGIVWDKNIDASGKTGTTNEEKDAWFCGVTPYYTLTVWSGYDNPATIPDLSKERYSQRIWSDVMNSLCDSLPEKHFEDYVETSEEEPKQNKIPINKGDLYYSFLPGRNDEEILSENYTVADYRYDHVIGVDAEVYIDYLKQINKIRTNDDRNKVEGYYNDGAKLIKHIIDENYRNLLLNKINYQYNSLINS